MRISLIVSLVSYCVLMNHSVHGQNISEQFIDSIVAHSMELMPQVGIAVAVIQDGKVVHSKGYGIKSIKTKEKIDENSLFAIASNSKAFTTMALGILIDEGKLKWTDKVIDYIPEFKMYDSYVTENFTIEDLLTHRSGLGLGAGDLMFFPSGGDFKIDDIIRSFQYQKPTSAFRTKFDYDNLLYIVAGEVVHRVSGMAWGQFVEERIMNPLDMNSSAALFSNIEAKKNVAEAHVLVDNKPEQINGYDEVKSIGAAGGIYSNVTDMAKWVMMHLKDGLYDGDKRLISSKNHHEMWDAKTNLSFDATPKGLYKTHYRSYGLGWFIQDKNGYCVVSHTGGLAGMLSQVVMIPELNAGIVVLTNCSPGGYSFMSVTNEIQDVLLGVDGPDWVEAMQTRIESNGLEADSVVNAVWETVSKADKKKILPEDYIGTYKDNWFGEVTVEKRKNELWFVSKRSPKLTGKMSFYKANTFAIKWEFKDMECDAFASFSLDENGKAQNIKMKGISPAIDFSFDFQDLYFQRIK